MVTIAVDAMGGDHGVSVVVPAVLEALSQYTDLSIILFGDESKISPYLKQTSHERLQIEHTDEFVTMDEPPGQALRLKKRSSMRLSINAVKSGQAKACVSAGNTGALMATARFVLKTISGVDRPALIYSMPTLGTIESGNVYVLDLGANVDCTADNLFQFGMMGSVLAEIRSGLKSPRVGLLNIGSEDIKGPESIRLCAARFEKSEQVNYVGFIEGNQLYRGHADVVVCDGFVGNVALKITEGVAKALLDVSKETLLSSWRGKLAGLLARPLFKGIYKRYDPSNHNGASLLGLNGSVVKSHGNASISGFVTAIGQARLEAICDLPQRIRTKVESDLSQEDI